MRTFTLLALASLSTLPAADLSEVTQQTVQIARALPQPRMAIPGSRQPQLSALHLAALDGDREELQQQLAGGANPNERTTGLGNLTPLHLAASSSSRRAVQTLIEAGASLEARDTSLGTTPIFAAAANFDPNHLTLLQLLVSGADPQARSSIVARGEDSLLPIHLAVGSPSAPAVAIQHLLAFGADPNGRAQPSGVTALHLAVLHPELTGKSSVDLTVINALLDPAYSAFGPADINARAAGGFTPLHFALLPMGAVSSSPTLLFSLAESGADLNATADDGSTPLDLAMAFHGAASAPALLLQQLGAQSGNAVPARPPGEGQGGRARRIRNAVPEVPDRKRIPGRRSAGDRVRQHDRILRRHRPQHEQPHGAARARRGSLVQRSRAGPDPTSQSRGRRDSYRPVECQIPVVHGLQRACRTRVGRTWRFRRRGQRGRE